MIVRKIIRLHSVDSTNNYIANLIKAAQIESGTVILAENQTNGRGQRSNSWVSEAGKNLMLSCYLRHENLSVQSAKVLNQVVSLALIDLLQVHGVPAQIKWPNDIVVNRKKIAGILIENQLRQERIYSSIIGVGLNVNQEFESSLQATSLFSETGTELVIQSVCEQLLYRFDLYYKLLSDGDFQAVEQLYLKNLWLLHQESRFEDERGIFTGVIEGLDQEGRLIIRHAENGDLRAYALKEVRFLERELQA